MRNCPNNSKLPDRALPPRTSEAAAAFTLVEVLAVVVIIVILTAIGLSVGKSVVGSGMKARAQETIKNAELIQVEHEVGGGSRINHLAVDTSPYNWGLSNPRTYNVPGVTGAGTELAGSKSLQNGEADGSPYDGQNRAPDIANKSIDRFVAATINNVNLKDFYARFEDDTLVDNDVLDTDTANGVEAQGFLELRDPWGNKLIYVAFVRDDDSEDTTSPLQRIGHKADDFLPRSDAPYFASAGPDGQWGDHRLISGLDATGYVGGTDYEELELQTRDNIYSNAVMGDQ